MVVYLAPCCHTRNVLLCAFLSDKFAVFYMNNVIFEMMIPLEYHEKQDLWQRYESVCFRRTSAERPLIQTLHILPGTIQSDFASPTKKRLGVYHSVYLPVRHRIRISSRALVTSPRGSVRTQSKISSRLNCFRPRRWSRWGGLQPPFSPSKPATFPGAGIRGQGIGKLFPASLLVQFFQAGSPPICEIIDYLASEELTMQILDITCTVDRKPVSVNMVGICDLRNEFFSLIRWLM